MPISKKGNRKHRRRQQWEYERLKGGKLSALDELAKLAAEGEGWTWEGMHGDLKKRYRDRARSALEFLEGDVSRETT
jgi:hypothetical protein